MPVTLFRSTDTGAKTLSGTVGDLITLLNSVLVLNRGTTETAGPTFADATGAWVQMGAGTALFVANNATTDRAYFGGQATFAQLIMKFATLGIGGTCAYEYWNGSAWTALVSPTDGTSGLTADGTLSWNVASQTGWAPTAVNGVTLYWVRVRWATAYSTNPVLKLGSIYGWGSPFQGTNGAVYRSQVTSGVQHYLNVNDNGPGVGTGKEARVFGAEALTQYNPTPNGGTGITGPFPTVAQATNGIFVRKSTTADATARAWKVLMDEKTFYMFVTSGDASVTWISWGFGEFYSLVSGDLYRSFLAARLTENSATISGSTGLNPLNTRVSLGSTGFTTTNQSLYAARAYTGTGGALLMAVFTGLGNLTRPLLASGGAGDVATFNGPDGGIFIAPVFLGDPTTHVRGRLRGLWDWGHAVAAATDADTFSGTGALSTKTFEELKTIGCFDGNVLAGVTILETSTTWEAN